MKNKLFTIIISIILLLPATVWAVDNMPDETSDPAAVENVQPTQMLDEDAQTAEESISNEQVKSSYKQPFSKKNLIKKFLLAMFAVLVSSITLYYGLSLYNKIRDGYAVPIKTNDGETSLQNPDDLESAVRTFLEKTQW